MNLLRLRSSSRRPCGRPFRDWRPSLDRRSSSSPSGSIARCGLVVLLVVCVLLAGCTSATERGEMVLDEGSGEDISEADLNRWVGRFSLYVSSRSEHPGAGLITQIGGSDGAVRIATPVSARGDQAGLVEDAALDAWDWVIESGLPGNEPELRLRFDHQAASGQGQVID